MGRRATRNASEISVLELQVSEHRLLVLSVGEDHARPRAVERLTAAERAVALDAIAGRSNRAIAARRGTTPRTVANQLCAVYRKLRVASRAELAARLTRNVSTKQ